MSFSDKSSDSIDWVPYKDRPEWNDVKPLMQNDGPHPVVQIAYSEKYRDIFNYFRAILGSKEISERAFSLSEDAVKVGPSNYTVWHFRRVLLKELNKDLLEELEFSKEIIEDNAKNYQVWHHRQVLVQWLLDPSHEKHLTEKILNDDAKNYHAWQHRQWVIREFDLWENELDFVNTLIEDDVRNNSAWNQRFFVVSNTTDLSDDVVIQEIAYTLKNIEKAPGNESPWNYLRGILQDKGLTKYPEVEEFTQRLYESSCRSPHLLGFIIDMIEEHLLEEGNAELCQKALDICDALAKKYDVIRKEYWNYIARNLGNLYGPEEAHAHTNE